MKFEAAADLVGVERTFRQEREQAQFDAGKERLGAPETEAKLHDRIEGRLRGSHSGSHLRRWKRRRKVPCSGGRFSPQKQGYFAFLPSTFAISKSMKSAWWKIHDSIVRSTLSPSCECVAMMCMTSGGRPCL